ncbi:16S rRNA (guanine(966)-N(2))-methyltransferase RsmD [Candidatus Pseudothioglobus sp. Uisw_086]|uniref:16S rRNA (guanine(966)-N(2))-methyltransferase RsmD n=1 Tax=Candidatus Pseudothioglobus sp. Uisw_086 TaxID=3230998 RepID=UPI003A8495F0
MKDNTFKIIAGNLKGRKFNFPDAEGLRPTPGKTRETLFNWLQFDIANKTIIDPFAGSGALSLEAISRGAKKVCLIEKNRKVFKNLELNFKLLSNSQYQLNNTDSVIFLDKQNNKPFDLVFLDPPFNQNLIPITLELLSQKNYLHNESQIYIESEFEITPALLKNQIEYDCIIRKQKKSGNVHYCLISFETI